MGYESRRETWRKWRSSIWNNGYWENNLILAEGYADDAIAIHYETREFHKKDFIMGHGYQWYTPSDLPFHTFYSFGFLGQAIYAVKELDLIFVLSSNIPIDRHKKTTYKLFKEFVLPACTDFNPDKNHQQNYQKLQEYLFNIEHPEPKPVAKIFPSFIKTINEIKYKFHGDNEFAFIENMFNKFYVKALTFNFIGSDIDSKAFKLEVITHEDCFTILVSLNSNFLTTKIMSDYGEILISARGAFENDNTMNIIYTTSCGMRNSFKVSVKERNSIECDVCNQLSPGIKKGYA